VSSGDRVPWCSEEFDDIKDWMKSGQEFVPIVLLFVHEQLDILFQLLV
jgi:hypothetical protein